MSRRRRLFERDTNAASPVQTYGPDVGATSSVGVASPTLGAQTIPSGGGATGGYGAAATVGGAMYDTYDPASGNAYDATQANEAYNRGDDRTHGQESLWADNR